MNKRERVILVVGLAIALILATQSQASNAQPANVGTAPVQQYNAVCLDYANTCSGLVR